MGRGTWFQKISLACPFVAWNRLINNNICVCTVSTYSYAVDTYINMLLSAWLLLWRILDECAISIRKHIYYTYPDALFSDTSFYWIIMYVNVSHNCYQITLLRNCVHYIDKQYLLGALTFAFDFQPLWPTSILCERFLTKAIGAGIAFLRINLVD